MKIAFFLGNMSRGGAERVISILADEYCNKGWDVDIVMLLSNKVEYPLDSRIRLIEIIGKDSSYLKNAVYWLRGIRQYLKTTKPDRVVSFIGRINALVLTSALGLGLPIVVSERNDPKHDGRGKLMQWYCNAIYHFANKIVYQNEYERSCFAKSLEKKGCVIPNPVRVTAVRSAGQSNTVVTAGRLDEQKNQKILIDAMAQVHKAYPDVACRIYGEGVLRSTLQKQIVDTGLQNVVTLEGNVTDLHERLAQCGVFVLSSNFEGLSNALIEAMMVGMPCITTDYPGARELIQDKENGMVVPMNDASALAEAICHMLENEAEAETMAAAAQQSAEKFKADRVLAHWNDVIEG